MDTKRKNSGMITVEAAFIIPFIWMIIFSMLSVALYFIDQAKVYAACDEVLIYASESVEKGCDLGNGKVDIKRLNRVSPYSFTNYSGIQKEIKNRFQERLSGKLLFLNPDKIQITVNSRELKIKILADALPPVCRFFLKKSILFEYTSKVQKADYSSFLRKAQVRLQNAE